jgi:hypothetical protein
MKTTRARTPLRLRATLIALSIVAMATQVGGATAAAVDQPRAAKVSAATVIPVPGERELLAWLARLTDGLRGPPVSGGWALLLAGLTGVWAIGRRRLSPPGSLSLPRQRLRRQ